jgi:DNA primase catalytic subunit
LGPGFRCDGIENIGVKFSGSKGMHVLIPWKAFPETIYNQKTKDMFPEWPRILCEFLGEEIKPRLAERIFADDSLKDLARKTGKQEEDLIVTECVSCKRPVIKKFLVTWLCPFCKIEKTFIIKNKRVPKCSECSKEMFEKSRKEILVCEYCNFNSIKNPEMFGKTREKTEGLIDADLVLVSPRHLFRMPYSLHEKTALSSIVLDKDKIMNFQIKDAKPLKVEIKNFYPSAKKDEAKRLLLEALDWHEQREKQEKVIQEKKGTFSAKKTKDFKKITIPNPSNDIFPPQIKLILKGVKQDGRKRALFILITFFKSLGVSEVDLEKRINNWNEKNYKPLKKGYIQSQLIWFRNRDLLPPNFSNPVYKDLGVDKPDELSKKTKNPVNYAVKKYFALGRT